MKEATKNAQTVEATEATKVSNEISNSKETLLIELEAKKEALKAIKKQEAEAKKAAQKAEKSELLKLKKEATDELKEKLFSLTQLCKTIKELNSIEALKLSTYFEKNSLNIEKLNPEFVAKNFPYKDLNGVCLKRVNLYKFNEQTQENELTGFFYYTKKQFWTINDVVSSVQRFLSKTSEIKNTEYLYTYKIDGQKRVEELTTFKLELN